MSIPKILNDINDIQDGYRFGGPVQTNGYEKTENNIKIIELKNGQFRNIILVENKEDFDINEYNNQGIGISGDILLVYETGESV